MVKGKVSSVMLVMECIMDKIKEKVDGSSRDAFDHKDVPRNQEVCYLNVRSNRVPRKLVPHNLLKQHIVFKLLNTLI